MLDVGPRALLAILIAVCGILAALLTNDVIALAMVPVLMQLCTERRLNPVPYLLAMACSVNAGSTATIIGAPQNMLIGQHMHLSFTDFMIYTAVPAILALGVIWLVVSFMISRKMLDLVDWQLLVLFIGLFIVNGAFQQTHIPQHWVDSLNAQGVDFQHPATLFVSTFVLSDIVSNVPAIMLLIPFATDPVAGPTMALAAGMASNLIVIGSIANIIVVDTAARHKLTITFWQHARTGIPVTLVSLSISAAWLWFLIGGG